jgi:hypothetical protein
MAECWAMIADQAQALAATRQTLNAYGLLLLSDGTLPSVCGLIVGEPLRGSWWGHPLGSVIYHVSSALEDQADVLPTRLVAGKVTFVHQRLWPALVAVGSAREDWQVGDLSRAACWLLQRTDMEGEVQTNDLPLQEGLRRKDLGPAARELERRLLVRGSEIHTPSGAHAKVLEAWQHWTRRTGFQGEALSPAEGRRQLEEAAARLGAAAGGASVRLAWQPGH